MSEKEKLDETQRRIAACLNAFDGIPTEKIEGKNLGEILAGEMRLNNAGPRADGGFGFEFSGGVCQLMAEAFAEQFKQSGAINYLELLFDHSDIGPLTITMQRVDGLTPAHKLAKAESERDALQQKLDAVLAENVALKDGVSEITYMDDESFFGSTVKAQAVMGRLVNTNTPATDALLNAVRAEGVMYVAESIGAKCAQLKVGSKDWKALKSVVFTLTEFAAQLRAGAPKGDSE